MHDKLKVPRMEKAQYVPNEVKVERLLTGRDKALLVKAVRCEIKQTHAAESAVQRRLVTVRVEVGGEERDVGASDLVLGPVEHKRQRAHFHVELAVVQSLVCNEITIQL